MRFLTKIKLSTHNSFLNIESLTFWKRFCPCGHRKLTAFPKQFLYVKELEFQFDLIDIYKNNVQSKHDFPYEYSKVISTFFFTKQVLMILIPTASINVS